jgi:hypothetical protein
MRQLDRCLLQAARPLSKRETDHMALLDYFVGDAQALHDAEERLRELEDRVFRLVEGEDADLGIHVRADIPRFEALNARQRLGQARFDRKSDVNLFIMAVGFAIVLAKLFGGFDLILKGLSAF